MNSTNPINILYLIDSLGNGGTERQLVELIKGLDRNRFRPHLCTLKSSTALYDELDIPKISLDFISFLHPSLFGRMLKLYRFVRNNRINIIQTFFQDPFLLAALIKPFYKVKLIGSFRDLGFWRTPTESRKMRIAYPFFDGFIANSQAVKDNFAQVGAIQQDKITVIYNSFSASCVKDIHHEHSLKDQQVVGIVANLNRSVKRVQDFIQAAALIHSQRTDVQFHIVGGGHLQPELEVLAETLGIGHCTIFTGRVDNPLDHIRKFSIGVITSETEGLCNAIIEYMACGIPVVATNVGGNPELITDAENGYLVPVGNAEVLAGKIVYLLDDEPLRSKIGVCNMEKISNEYTVLAMLEKHVDYYSHISNDSDSSLGKI